MNVAYTNQGVDMPDEQEAQLTRQIDWCSKEIIALTKRRKKTTGDKRLQPFQIQLLERLNALMRKRDKLRRTRNDQL